MTEFTNSEKSNSGQEAKNSLNNLLKSISKNFPSQFEYTINIKDGEVNKNPKQFGTDAKIVFKQIDGGDEIWLIKVSSSYRADRHDGFEFNTEHLIKAIEDRNPVDTPNIKCYFVIPDSASEKDIKVVESLNERIVNEAQVTYFDGAMIMHEFRNLLVTRLSLNFSQGSRSNVLGELGEHEIVDAFMNKTNKEIWNNDVTAKTKKSYNYDLFRSIMIGFGLDENNKIRSIDSVKSGSYSQDNSAYDKNLDIVLDSKTGKAWGKPKTDVYVKLTLKNNKKIEIKISRIVKSSATPVT